MPEDITAKLANLVKDGRDLVDELASQDDDSWIDFGDVRIYETWLGTTGQLLLSIGGPQSEHFVKFREIIDSQRNPVGVKTYVVRRVFDLVLAVFEEWSCGSLQKFEDIVAAPILDDLLDQADRYRSSDRKIESLALTCAVVEHTLRRIASKNRIRSAGKSLQALADELVSSTAFDEQARSRLKESLTVCCHASSTDWDAIEPDDLVGLIAESRKLVEEFA
jgi:hypothetical protein